MSGAVAKNISVVTTGGTIGSVLEGESVSVDRTGARVAREISIAQERLGYRTTLYPALNKNSEDFSPADWSILLKVLEQANRDAADGIVVTHGTDTMHFSVAAALCFAEAWKTKVCFTGSFYPPDHPSSDASINLVAALEFAAAANPARGVYVVFRSNPEGEARVVRAADLKPMAFDESSVDAAYGMRVAPSSPYGELSPDTIVSRADAPSLGKGPLPDPEAVEAAARAVSILPVYPGIDASLVEAAAANREFLIVQMYHSGTGPSLSEGGTFLEALRAVATQTTVLMGTFPKRLIETPYGSTREMIGAGASVFADLQVHFLYTFAVLGLSIGMTPSGIVSKLDRWRI